MKIENELTRMLGIRYPIIQGAFGLPNTGTSRIAVPVSDAGGLGILTTIAYASPEAFRADLTKARSGTDKPLAVNFTLLKNTKYDFDYHSEYIKAALDEGIKIAFTSAYDGSRIGHIFKEAGGVWIHKCATIKHAVSIAGKGADAVVIVGIEGTGSKSPEQHSTLINMTAGRRRIPVPLIAAGGIGDGRGLVAALAMGASGVYMGTAFMATKEFPLPEKDKEKIINQDITDGAYIKEIYGMKYGVLHSFSSGVLESLPTVADYIESMMAEAAGVMSQFKKWGMVGLSD